MNLKELELKDLKALVYDESKALAIIQNNIRLIEEEIRERSQTSKDEE